MAGWKMDNEDVFPIEDGDFPASHVSLPECIKKKYWVGSGKYPVDFFDFPVCVSYVLVDP